MDMQLIVFSIRLQGILLIITTTLTVVWIAAEGFLVCGFLLMRLLHCKIEIEQESRAGCGNEAEL